MTPPVEMTKERAVADRIIRQGTANTAHLSTTLRFGRDDKGERRRFHRE
jgi:hypothetical protein